MEYVVNLAVTSRMQVHVEADSVEEAIEKANGVMSEADCSPLYDIDWETRNVEDNKGNIIYPEGD